MQIGQVASQGNYAHALRSHDRRFGTHRFRLCPSLHTDTSLRQNSADLSLSITRLDHKVQLGVHCALHTENSQISWTNPSDTESQRVANLLVRLIEVTDAGRFFFTTRWTKACLLSGIRADAKAAKVVKDTGSNPPGELLQHGCPAALHAAAQTCIQHNCCPTCSGYNPQGLGAAWSHNFLNQKPWHPANFRNQAKVYEAEQQAIKAQRDKAIAKVSQL